MNNSLHCPGSWTRKISMKAVLPSAIFLISVVSVFTLVFQILLLLQRNNRKYSTLVTNLNFFLSSCSLLVVYEVLSKNFVCMSACLSVCLYVQLSLCELFAFYLRTKGQLKTNKTRALSPTGQLNCPHKEQLPFSEGIL